jgi:outer membrane lipoprotein LolB
MHAWWLVLLMSTLLAGCATPNSTAQISRGEQANTSEWQGRISVQVQGDKPTSISASFLLRGNAQQGELDLYSPLGTTLGALKWTPQRVQLSDGSKPYYFHTLAELTEKTTGAALPIEAIFGWLQGRNVQASGWLADLSDLSQGSLTARRTDPAPEVTLRIKLDP